MFNLQKKNLRSLEIYIFMYICIDVFPMMFPIQSRTWYKYGIYRALSQKDKVLSEECTFPARAIEHIGPFHGKQD